MFLHFILCLKSNMGAQLCRYTENGLVWTVSRLLVHSPAERRSRRQDTPLKTGLNRRSLSAPRILYLYTKCHHAVHIGVHDAVCSC